MTRLVQADRKGTITQITSCYNQSLQKSFFEGKTSPIFKQMESKAAEDHTWFLSRQLRIGGYGLNRLTKIKQ